MADGDLWEEFHHVVNLTSRELADMSRADGAGERTEALPDQEPTAGEDAR